MTNSNIFCEFLDDPIVKKLYSTGASKTIRELLGREPEKHELEMLIKIWLCGVGDGLITTMSMPEWGQRWFNKIHEETKKRNELKP